jgi:hypothetical protein
MQVIRDGIQLCEDCLFAAVNGDVTGVGDIPGITAAERIQAIEAGLTRLGPNLVSDFDSETGKGCNEFSVMPCDCCGTKLYGSRHEFAILGES